MVAVDGAFAVRNLSGVWTIPDGHAALIPAGIRHSIAPLRRALTRTVYYLPARRNTAAGLEERVRVFQLSPLVRAIADHVHETGMDDASARRLLAVLEDQLPRQRELPLFLPALTSMLARRAAGALQADPADTPRTRDLAAGLEVSGRTLERAFAADAGMALGEWRQRARISRAIALLADGMAVKDVALEVGYETPSAFIAVFKKYAGRTPGKT